MLYINHNHILMQYPDSYMWSFQMTVVSFACHSIDFGMVYSTMYSPSTPSPSMILRHLNPIPSCGILLDTAPGFCV